MFRKNKVEIPEGYKLKKKPLTKEPILVPKDYRLARFPVTGIQVFVPREFRYTHEGPTKNLVDRVFELDRGVSDEERESSTNSNNVLVPGRDVQAIHYTTFTGERTVSGVRIPNVTTIYGDDFLDFEGAFVGGIGEMSSIVQLSIYHGEDPRNMVFDAFKNKGMDISRIDPSDAELEILGGFLGLIEQGQIKYVHRAADEEKGTKRVNLRELTTTPRILPDEGVEKYDEMLQAISLKEIGTVKRLQFGVGRHDPQDNWSIMDRYYSDRMFRSYTEKKKAIREENGDTIPLYVKPLDLIDTLIAQFTNPKNRFDYFVGKSC